MTQELLQEFLNDISVLAGIVSGILLVVIFAVVWGYSKSV